MRNLLAISTKQVLDALTAQVEEELTMGTIELADEELDLVSGGNPQPLPPRRSI